MSVATNVMTVEAAAKQAAVDQQRQLDIMNILLADDAGANLAHRIARG